MLRKGIRPGFQSRMNPEGIVREEESECRLESERSTREMLSTGMQRSLAGRGHNDSLFYNDRGRESFCFPKGMLKEVLRALRRSGLRPNEPTAFPLIFLCFGDKPVARSRWCSRQQERFGISSVPIFSWSAVLRGIRGPTERASLGGLLRNVRQEGSMILREE